MNDTLRTFLTVALTLSILTAFGGIGAANPTTADAGPTSADADLDAPSVLDDTNPVQVTSYNDSNSTDPCSPFRQWGIIC